MKLAIDVLRRFVDAPTDPHELRGLLDDCGLEVKRAELAGERTVFTLELLANRGDHHCYEGVARELHGRLGAGLRTPESTPLAIADGAWPVRVTTELCTRYTATVLEGEGGELPPAALRILEAAGIHSLGAPIDATNVANLELGQPTHAFDAAAVDGCITVRRSRPGESCRPLFSEQPVVLPEGTLVIADDIKILAVAGVIGCEESKTTAATRRIVLESAAFDPVAVRKASRALGIHTDSSARFERGSDHGRVVSGAGRAVRWLEAAGWRRVGATVSVGGFRDPGRVVRLRPDAVNRFLATDLDAGEIAERLGRYGFSVRDEGGALSVGVPSWRLWDVEFAADLYEELAKSIGYNHTPVGLPPVRMGSRPQPWEVRRNRVEDVLLGHGFYEVFTDGFYGRDAVERLGVEADHPLHHHVSTLNALDRGYSLLKNNALAQAVDAMATNERRRTLDVKLYEWTRTFHPADGVIPQRADPRHPPCRERPLLWLAAMGAERARTWAGDGRAADVWFLKGVVDELAAELGLDLAVGAADPSHPLSSALHPNRQGVVILDGAVVGILGEVHPDVRERAKLKHGVPVYLEIDAAALLSEGSRARFEEPSPLQPVTRNLAFTLPHRVEAGAVQAFLHASGDDNLRRVRIVDHFEHGEGVRTVTFELTWGDPTVSAEATNAALQRLIQAVIEQFGDAGVRLR